MSPIFVGGRAIFGALSSQPTGITTTAGSKYYNTTDNETYVFSGASSSWKKVSGNISTNDANPFNDSSVIATFPLNGNATSLPGTTYSGTLGGDNGSSHFSTGGQFGQYWNGTGTNHLTTNSTDIVPSGSYTLSFWYKSNSTGQSNKRVLTVKGATVSSGWNNYNNSLGFYTGAGVATSSQATATVTRVAQIPDAEVNDNVWHHLVYTVTSSSNWNIYMDGSSYSGAVSGEGRSFNSGTRFAVTTYDGGDNYNSVNGVDQIRLFNRVLTLGEIQDLYNES
tara:strand:+ start:668 stop:1507 length:840 start_codon:yes stop_codon:yes gene_type:complete